MVPREVGPKRRRVLQMVLVIGCVISAGRMGISQIVSCSQVLRNVDDPLTSALFLDCPNGDGGGPSGSTSRSKSFASAGGKTGECFKCGKTGHWSSGA